MNHEYLYIGKHCPEWRPCEILEKKGSAAKVRYSLDGPYESITKHETTTTMSRIRENR